MQHKGTVCLESRRLLLRPFTMQDASAMFLNWASDSEVTAFLTWPAHASVEVTEAVLKDWTAQYADKKYYKWAIVLKDLGQPIGSITVNNVIDDNLKMAHVGYCIGRAWWGKGITTEAMQTVMDFLFDEVGVNRVESLHNTRNGASGAVMRKCGMKFEGIHRQADWSNAGLGDAAYYALLAQER